VVLININDPKNVNAAIYRTLNKLFSTASKRNTDELVRKDEQAIIGEAFLELPLKQREVLIYFYFNDMTIAEVAHILSIPEGTVKTRLRRSKDY